MLKILLLNPNHIVCHPYRSQHVLQMQDFRSVMEKMFVFLI